MNEAAMSKAEMRCPRRDESFWGMGPGVDHWSTRDGPRVCSFCGSLHPDAFFEAVEAGCEVTPTDKNYKVYIELPNPEAGKPAIYSYATSRPSGDGWIEVTAENIGDLPGHHSAKPGYWVQISRGRPTVTQKFYFQHLSSEEHERFIKLHNERRIKLAYPGYFYVRPFFASLVEA